MERNAEQHESDTRRRPGRRAGAGGRHRPRLAQTTPAITALVGLALIAAGCGGSKPPGTAAGADAFAQFEAYARCMRSHGIRDFPDPTSSPGGGVAIQIHGGPGSDLNRSNPRFMAADQACRSLEPGRSGTPQQSAQKIGAEVKWAQCMRAHGVPSFPDPDRQGAFDSSKFDESTPAFQSASTACQSLMNAVGAIPVHPGRG
jgi:hypothetical protein